MPSPFRRVVLGYALGTTAWVLLSDLLVGVLFQDPAMQALAQSSKRWLFVMVTTALLYVLLRRLHRQMQESALQRVEALQREAHASMLLRTLADTSPDAIYVKDGEGRFVFFNREAARLSQVRVADVIGQQLEVLFPPAQAEALRANDETVMGQDHAMSFEEAVDTVDGPRIYQAIKGPLRDAAGIIGTFGISRDITEMVAVRQQLRANERRYRLLFESNPQAMWVFDLQTLAFLAVNRSAERRFGYSRSEFLALRLHDVIHPDELPALHEAMAQLGPVSPLGVTLERTWRHRTRDGRVIEAEVSINDLEFEGRAARLVLVSDVTLQKQADQHLLQAQRELSELSQRLLSQEQQTSRQIAQSLHDRVVQLLGSARMYLDVAQARVLAASNGAPCPLRQVSDTLDGAIAEVRHVLRDLRPPLLEELGLHAALNHELQHSPAQGLGLQVALEQAASASGMRWPEAVEYAVFMIAREAIANALRHAQARHLVISIDGDAGQLRLKVEDDGQGMGPAARQGRPGHLGMVGMRERAASIGASLAFGSRPGGGTVVTLTREGWASV